MIIFLFRNQTKWKTSWLSLSVTSWFINVSFIRAVLEDLAHGPGPVCSPVRCHDSGQHLSGGLRLQECQVCPQTQVRQTDAHAAVSTLSSVQRMDRGKIQWELTASLFFWEVLITFKKNFYLCFVTGLLRNERMLFLRRWPGSCLRLTTARCPARRKTRGSVEKNCLTLH